MRIKECRICSSSRIEEVLNLGSQPPANSLYGPEENLPNEVPLRLVMCKDCSTVQLGEDVNPEYLFGNIWNKPA